MQTITSEDTSTSLTLASAPYSLQVSNWKSFKNNYIFTNDCTFNPSSDEAIIATNDFHLHTTEFFVNRDGAIIDASGDNGSLAIPAKPGPPKEDAVPERPDGLGGHQIYLSSTMFVTDKKITLKSKGGNGLNRPKESDSGGNGGNGGNVVLHTADKYSDLLGMATVWLKATKDEEKKAGRRAWVEHMQRVIRTPDYLVKAIGKLATSIADSDDWDDAKDIMVDKICAGLDSESDLFAYSHTINVTGGLYGAGREGKSNGNSGKLGTVQRIRMSTKSMLRQSVILVHPDQITMTLRDIEDDYFLGSEESLLRCGASLSKLIQRLKFVETLTPDTPLYQAYAQKEKALFILPRDQKSTVPTSVDSLKESLTRSVHYARQLSEGLDFYGHAPSWVPQGRFLLYKEDLDVILNDYKDVESNYWDYKNKNLGQQKRIDAIRVGQTKANSIIQRARNDLAYLANDLVVTANLIAALSPPLPTKREILLDAISKLADKIQHAFQVSFGDFINAITMIASAPGLPMAIIQGIGTIVDRNGEVVDDSGLKVKKDYILNKILGIRGDLAGISEGLKLLKDGSYKIDDPGAAKLVMEEQSLMDLIGQYRSLLGEDTLKDVKSKFDDYIHAVVTRNNRILHYNADIVLYKQTYTELKSQQRQIDVLGRIQLETIDLELPSIAAFVEKSFFITTGQILKMLYRTQRALAFYALQPDSSDLSSFRMGGFRRKGLAAALKAAKVNIYDAYHRAIEGSTSNRQAFGYHKIGHGDSTAPVVISLDNAQLSTLKSHKEVIIHLAEVYPHTSRVDSPFASFADVRLTNVRVYLDGAKTEDGDLLILIEHFGKDAMVNTMGKVYRFTHNPLYFKFKYSLTTRKILLDGDIEDVVAKEYAPPGPFSTWRIRIHDPYNQSPDLSGVTKCWFEFSGSCRSFST